MPQAQAEGPETRVATLYHGSTAEQWISTTSSASTPQRTLGRSSSRLAVCFRPRPRKWASPRRLMADSISLGVRSWTLVSVWSAPWLHAGFDWISNYSSAPKLLNRRWYPLKKHLCFNKPHTGMWRMMMTCPWPISCYSTDSLENTMNSLQCLSRDLFRPSGVVNSLYSFSPGNETWTVYSSVNTPSARRFLGLTAAPNGLVYLFGGQDTNGGVTSCLLC